MGRVLWSISLPSLLLSFFPLLLISCLLSAGEAAQVLDFCIPRHQEHRGDLHRLECSGPEACPPNWGTYRPRALRGSCLEVP